MLMYIGACGWDHKEWENTYYDKDLPADWRLTFYARQYKTVLVPYEYWSSKTIDNITEFGNDVGDEYPIIFEMPEDQEKLTHKFEKPLAEIIKNQIRFNSADWQYNTDHYLIEQAEILHNTSLGENVAVFKVSAEIDLIDKVIREILQTLKKEFHSISIIYLFFDGALLNINSISTGCTLLRFQNLT